MFERADQEIKQWVEEVADNLEPSFAEPHDQDNAAEINTYLFDFVPVPSSGNRLVNQFKLRYLVTTWSKKPAQAHALLGKLFQAALYDSKFQVEAEPLPAESWQALKISPRPSFFLCYVLTLLRTQKQAPPVTEAPGLTSVPLISVQGRLTGPNGYPLTKTRIELPQFKRSALTDRDGRFNFGKVSATATTLKFRIHVKTLESPVAYDCKDMDGNEIMINLHNLEV
ncbi:MAG: hypothetical protein ACU85E_08985 [Gammaproteobacteria bacterium]